MLYSFGTQNCGQLVLRNYPRFLQELSIPGNPLFDITALAHVEVVVKGGVIYKGGPGERTGPARR